jgi:gas vesicle protein
MKRTLSFLSGVLTGAVVGGALAILMAPASGQELRTRMRARAESIQAEVQQAAAQRRAELERQLAALRRPQTPAE